MLWCLWALLPGAENRETRGALKQKRTPTRTYMYRIYPKITHHAPPPLFFFSQPGFSIKFSVVSQQVDFKNTKKTFLEKSMPKKTFKK
jgi:hypothetical protein